MNTFTIDDIERITQSIVTQSTVPLSGLDLPIESVSVFPTVGKTLFVSLSVRENKICDKDGTILSIEIKRELAFLAGKSRSWPVGHPEQTRDYSVKQAEQEERDAPMRVFEAPLVTVEREMQE